MKIGLIISSLLHATLLGWGLFWLSAPKSFEVADIEALPVDIIPVSSITRLQQGDDSAAVAEVAAPSPTTRAEPVEDAVNVGDNTVDLESARAADPRPTPVEATQAPQRSDRPVPDPLARDAPRPTARPDPASATEVAALPEPQETVQADPVAEAISEAADSEAQVTPFPTNVPTPIARPSPPRDQTAQSPERETNDTPSEATRAASAKDSEFDSNEVAALLNRQDPAGGGARRSDREAALGTRTSTTGQELSQSEMDALRGQIQRCWQIVPGMADGADVRVQVTMRLNRAGEIDGQPSVEASGGSAQTRRVLAGGARRAVLRCAPYTLPAEKYETWADVIVNFDPSKMF